MSEPHSIAPLGDRADTHLEPGPFAVDSYHGIGMRLKEIKGSGSCSCLGKQVGMSIESVRRQIQLGRPSLQFIQGLCRQLGISPLWLLTGIGPQQIEDVPAWGLTQVTCADLLLELERRRVVEVVRHSEEGSTPRDPLESVASDVA